MKKKAAATFATVAILSMAYSSSASASELYTVKKGDTLSGIAAKAKSSVADIKTINKLTSDRIFLDQKLFLPGPAVKAPAELSQAGKATSAKAKTYIVVKGDSLSAISVKTGITIGNLKSLNNLKGDIIYIGQVLKLEAASTVAVKPPTPTKPADQDKATAPPPQTNKPEPPSQTIPESLGVYVVVSGDTLGKISLNFRTTVEDLKGMNGLASDMIRVGQVLKVPATVETAQPATPLDGDKSLTAAVITFGKSLVGTPYVWGGSTIEGFDCSGFIYYVYNQAGNQLVRHSAEGYYNRSYEIDKPVAGDLVFFENTYKKGISHMGIYLGDNLFLHADAVKGVTITSLDDPYYNLRFESFKRFY
ncbi:LysM peptidoglycan-binding domain-containing protein [Bacillus sp. FJAT-27445]|uniref:C40 family peptidase n=1 Tax=Bacillus sp. FJAT-27445 TaxID=1679166 RepID=UPI000743D153|nr:peptidoglycan endopeptidase [Bacillus sp. FJAT-27445]